MTALAAERIGVAIATFNSEEVIRRCLGSLAGWPFIIVLFDDGSSDDTVAAARATTPEIVVLDGDGTNWWAGGTARAVTEALDRGCDWVVLLNPDVEITGDAIMELASYTVRKPNTIVAPLVVDRLHPDEVAWAGSRFGRLPALPIYTSRYVHRRGTKAAAIGSTPYRVDEVHGRGTVLSRQIIDRIGMFDTATFPHYGADNDYSWRARAAGIDILVIPTIRAHLDVQQSGMAPTRAGPRDRVALIRDYLLERKNGEALRVWWELTGRHVPRHARLPSFVFNVGVNVIRRLK